MPEQDLDPDSVYRVCHNDGAFMYSSISRISKKLVTTYSEIDKDSIAFYAIEIERI